MYYLLRFLVVDILPPPYHFVSIFIHIHIFFLSTLRISYGQMPGCSLKRRTRRSWKWGYSTPQPVVVQSLSPVQRFATLWTAACESPLSLIVSWSLLKLVSTERVMLSNHLILRCPLLLLPSVFPSITVFFSELAFCISGQNIGALASVSVLPVNIRGWFPLD